MRQEIVLNSRKTDKIGANGAAGRVGDDGAAAEKKASITTRVLAGGDLKRSER